MNTLSLTLCLILAGQQATITWPLRTEVTKDVDGDGQPDKLVYEIKPWEKDYEGYLKITSARGETLWEDGWPMAKDDLEELIETEGGVTGKKVDMKSWVKKFFSGELNYGAHYSREKLKATDLWDDPLDASAEILRCHQSKSQKEHSVAENERAVFLPQLMARGSNPARLRPRNTQVCLLPARLLINHFPN